MKIFLMTLILIFVFCSCQFPLNNHSEHLSKNYRTLSKNTTPNNFTYLNFLTFFPDESLNGTEVELTDDVIEQLRKGAFKNNQWTQPQNIYDPALPKPKMIEVNYDFSPEVELNGTKKIQLDFQYDSDQDHVKIIIKIPDDRKVQLLTFNECVEYIKMEGGIASKNQLYLFLEALYNARQNNFFGMYFFYKKMLRVFELIKTSIDFQNQKNFLKNLTLRYAGLPEKFQKAIEWVQLKKEAVKISYENKLLAIAEKGKEYSREIKKYREQKKLFKLKNKEKIDTLDKEQKLFHDIVLSGDRKRFAELLKNYIDSTSMPPLEKGFWEQYFEIINNPLPISQHVIIYRGLGDDQLQYNKEKFPQSDKKKALLNAANEDGVSVFSSMLTQNQGTWTRRLRSFFGINDPGNLGDHSGEEVGAQFSRILRGHAADPMGSPFISLTPSLKIALQYASNDSGDHYRLGAFLIDPRLLAYNFVGFEYEFEYIIPWVLFPDQLVAYLDLSSLEIPENINIESPKKSALIQKMKELITQSFTRRNLSDARTLTDKIFDQSQSYFINQQSGGPSQRSTCLEILLKSLTK